MRLDVVLRYGREELRELTRVASALDRLAAAVEALNESDQSEVDALEARLAESNERLAAAVAANQPTTSHT